MNHTVGSYQKVGVETTDPLKLIVMLYEGAINFLEQAKKRMSENRVADKGVLVDKVVAIVSELQGSLNMDGGGEVAQSLDRLYTYMINRLLEANINNDPEAFTEVSKHLRILKDAWNSIAGNGSKQPKGSDQPAASIPGPAAKDETERRGESAPIADPIELIG